MAKKDVLLESLDKTRHRNYILKISAICNIFSELQKYTKKKKIFLAISFVILWVYLLFTIHLLRRTSDAYDTKIDINDDTAENGFYFTNVEIDTTSTITTYPRLVCLVPTLIIPSKYAVLQAIGQTWGSKCDRLYFVIDDTNPFIAQKMEIFNATILKINTQFTQSVKDRNIWEKTWRMWHYAGTNLLNEGDFFFKIDDDTFFSAVNFRAFAQHFNADSYWYLGHTLFNEWRQTNSVFNAGACYSLSRGALRKLYPIFETDAFLQDPQRGKRGYCVDRKGDNEDPTIAICLRSIGINPTNTLDHLYRNRFMIFKPDKHRTWNREKYTQNGENWYVQHKHSKQGYDKNCCAPHPIAFHYFKNESYTEFAGLDEMYNIEPYEYDINLGQNNSFLFNENAAPRHDQWFNALDHIPKGQRIYLGPGQERICHKCDGFKLK